MPDELAKNRERLNNCAVKILGKSLSWWRQQARLELSQRAEQYCKKLHLPCESVDPNKALVVTGHQPQFFHCGVLMKYILLGHLAKASDAATLNLVADSDLPGQVELKIPVWQQLVQQSDVRRKFVSQIIIQQHGRLSVARLAPAKLIADLPMEFQPVPRMSDLDDFQADLEMLQVDDKLSESLRKIGQILQDCQPVAQNLAELLTLLVHRLTKPLGLDWAELAVSQMAQTVSFNAFTADLLARPLETWTCYNTALADYRRENKIRSNLQPLPDLRGEANPNQLLEMPFWVFHPGQPRQRLFVRHEKSNIIFSTGPSDTNQLPIELLREPLKILLEPAKLLQRLSLANVFLRPRALTLTAFTRLFLADYFVHGIGGAKYDRVTDGWIRRFYQVEPPAYACVSATMHLGLGEFPRPAEIAPRLKGLQQRRRDLQFNPQRYLGEDFLEVSKIKSLLQRRRQAIETGCRLRKQQAESFRRRAVFEEIAQLNTAILKEAPGISAEVENDLKITRQQQKNSNIAFDREYFFGLFTNEQLNKLMIL
ncbi:MAG: hypothetical protein JXD22_04830 [Sedimentisphaerales bacterium]|nr:hypothetical protein [Sedimentisphaerales bacterium]